MDNNTWLFDARYCKLKTARQKKRLQKEDKEKRLRSLWMYHDKLWQERQRLPFVPITIPYQKGWVRDFKLRDDIARSNSAAFFTELLNKINTKAFCNEKNFLQKKKKKRKRAQEPLEQ